MYGGHIHVPARQSQQQSRNGFGVAAFVLGVIAVVFLLSMPVFGLVVAVPAAPAALLCGLVGLARVEEGSATNKAVAVAGLLSGLGSTMGVIAAVAAAIGPQR